MYKKTSLYFRINYVNYQKYDFKMYEHNIMISMRNKAKKFKIQI